MEAVERVHKLDSPGSSGILGGKQRSELDKKAALPMPSLCPWDFCIWNDFFLEIKKIVANAMGNK